MTQVETRLTTATIKHLVLYPVKSCAGSEHDVVLLTPGGLETTDRIGDREWMIVRAKPDEKGVHGFITQRDKREPRDATQGLSEMVLIRPELTKESLRLTWQGQDGIEISAGLDSGESLLVNIWEHTGLAVDQGETPAEWLSDHLKLAVRLVKAAGPFWRGAKQNYIRNPNTLRFQDGYPVHWFSLESIEELSQIAGEEISWKQFRPNVVVEGIPAQSEHLIQSGTVESVPFVDPKPCDRCSVTGVDPETGRLKNLKPLAILNRYKRWINDRGELTVIFGENMLPQGTGPLRVGSILEFTEYRNPPLIYGPCVKAI